MKNSYFRISWLRNGHSNAKFRIDWLFPLIISISYFLINLYFFYCDKPIVFFQSKSFDKIIGLFQILPGFYIAALAAIFSIQPKDINNSGSNDLENAIQLKTRAGKLDDIKNSKLIGYINGQKRTLPIRLLLTRGLAHLAITSLLLIVFSTFINYLVEVQLVHFFYENLNEKLIFQIIKILVDTLFIFLISQTLSITFFITKFLGDELNRV